MGEEARQKSGPWVLIIDFHQNLQINHLQYFALIARWEILFDDCFIPRPSDFTAIISETRFFAMTYLLNLWIQIKSPGQTNVIIKMPAR